MPSEKQLQGLNRYVDVIHELLIDQITGIRTTASRQMMSNVGVYVRLFGQMLYEAPKIHSGYVSVRLIEQKLQDFSVHPCHEHFESRQRGGAALVSFVERALRTGKLPSKEEVFDVVYKHCQVHYTTAQENAMLRKHQRKCSSEAAYRRANIRLVEARDLFSHRGRHSDTWKEQMIRKYQPIVDAYNNPPIIDIEIPDYPVVIN